MFDAEVRGVNPNLHIAIHEIIAAQLWADDPPEAWQAARRLRDQGHERHEILHRLGEVIVDHLYGALSEQHVVDVDAYRRDLERLAAGTAWFMAVRPSLRVGRRSGPPRRGLRACGRTLRRERQ